MKTAAGISAFRRRFEDQRDALRRRRSWRLMLWVDKTYSMVIRGGWRGRWNWLKWMAKSPVRGFTGLKQFEPQFPEILDFLPLHSPRQHNSGFPPAVKYDVIVLPVFDFDFRYQRPQHLARQFAASGHRVFWISPSRRAHGQPYEAVALAENLWEIHLDWAIPNLYRDELQPADIEGMMAGLRALFRDAALVANCALLQLPFWRPLGLKVRQEWSSQLAYDCMDNWQSFPGVSESVRKQEWLLSQEADVLTVTARQLFEMQLQRGTSPVLIRNAADYEFFAAGHSEKRLADLPQPVIGYYGAIAEWFDFMLLRQLAKARPKYSFVLIGAMGLERDLEIEEWEGIRNIHLLGHKPYAELPSYLTEFDVCLIPFLRNHLTDATDPVKLYEYLSQGKPVVSTDLAEVREHLPHVAIARNLEESLAAIDAALAEDGSQRPARQNYARENSWKHRKDQLSDLIHSSFPLVSIVIVTHNSAAFLPACLGSLARHATYPRTEVICVDCASTDHSVDMLRSYNVQVIASAENLGFAKANNLGVRQSTGQYIVFLNADTVVTAGWIERLMRHLRQDPKIGLVNPVTNSAGNEAKIRCDYGNLLEMDQFAASLAREQTGAEYPLDVCPLFCAMISRPIWDELGELDERFGRGMFEDDDYSVRAKRAGYKTVAAEDCFVHHFGGGSFKSLPSREYEATFNQNLAYFEDKWNCSWKGHRYRPGIDMPNRQYFPELFL